MKKILGLDLGTNSIGWAVVNEAEKADEQSSIVKLGVRTISYDNFVSTETGKESKDPVKDFSGGKGISCNAGRTMKRSARRNLQRYKLRREHLIEILKTNGFISDDTILSENGNRTTFETYRLRAKAATEEITLAEFARVLLMINKKRGYKSIRKAKNTEEGQLIDGMEIAKRLYNENLTPGQFSLELLKNGKKYLPDFYRSDLQTEFDKVWDVQKRFYPEILTDDLKEKLQGKNKTQSWAICQKPFGIEGVKRRTKGNEQKVENYSWRVKALSEQMDLEELAIVLQEINGQINNASGYLGDISDRSKELYFNHQTVGQYQMAQLDKNPNYSLKNQVFYRQDYLNEFEAIWETQARFHKELTSELKKEIRDVVIFYQRPLKSQKGLISFCEFESRQIEVEIEGKKKIKTVGNRVCPKSSPLFQEFKIWQRLNDVEVSGMIVPIQQHDLFGFAKDYTYGKRRLQQEEKERLFAELNYKEKLSKAEVLKMLFPKQKEVDMNFKDLDGNHTQAELFKAYQTIAEQSGHDVGELSKKTAKEIVGCISEIFATIGINTEILSFNSNLEGKEFEQQPLFRLWHLLYSFEGDNSAIGNEKLIEKLCDTFGFEKEYAAVLANVIFKDAGDYSSLSTKAIRKILPHLKDGLDYSTACEYAGYRHSKQSLTKEEIQNKVLKDKLELLPRNSLRNPVVEKILNQMINVVNSVVDTYGKPDEIRIELARELKKSAKEREELSKSINETTRLHEELVKKLQKEFGLSHVSRNDIIRYKLYNELESNGYKTLYTNTYIPREKLFSKEFDIEHIIPQAKLFDDSFSNKTLEARQANLDKSNTTAFDFVSTKYGDEFANGEYKTRIDKLLADKVISKTKHDKLLMKEADIPSGFINRDLRDSQYIAKKAREILEELVRFVVPTTGTITDRLRDDWQLVDVMQELNWNKYDQLGMTEIVEGRDGQRIRRIKDWTKRNDHRHHAMDALTIAFTKRSFIQYLNNLNARVQKGVDDWIDLDMVEFADLSKEDKTKAVYAIEKKELYRDNHGRLRFNPPMPLNEFRAEAKRQLENTLISIKAKNKVVTRNINKAKNNVTSVIIDKDGNKKTIKGQLTFTPRGKLHEQTIYGQNRISRIELNDKISKEQIGFIVNPNIKGFIQNKVKECGSIKKTFSKENISNIIYKGKQIKYLIVAIPCFTQRIDIQKFFTDPQKSDSAKVKAINSIIDLGIRKIVNERFEFFEKDFKKAFSNLTENPIWLNKEKGIAIKRVTITGISNAEALHDKRDKDGNLILDENGNKQPVDYVNTGNNHHVAIYRKPKLDKNDQPILDENGDIVYELDEKIVSFYEATSRAMQHLPIIDKTYNQSEGWQFLFTMKQNEYFVFPRYDADGNMTFNPLEHDEAWFKNPENYAEISPNLFRVQKIATRDYFFRHHLETTVQDNAKLKGITWKRFGLNGIENIVKVRVNHIGQIVSVGEY
ncbi:MAG: type II CRISPR RNA-guided endonuclease Cas9 [Paludibacteraceae bacterium]|nr:type II CRISPR RNA-guided endonuclease Cas9 [Paludibacteraceae bacterium]